MSNENTQPTNRPQEDAAELNELSDEALDDLISSGSEASRPWDWDR